MHLKLKAKMKKRLRFIKTIFKVLKCNLLYNTQMPSGSAVGKPLMIQGIKIHIYKLLSLFRNLSKGK